MRYRRSAIKGATYFFTVNLAERRLTLLIDEIERLMLVIRKIKRCHDFKIEAMVVLPDHMHALWTLPLHDHDYAKRWMLIKSGFSRQLPKTERINRSRMEKRERGIWQRRYWEHLIRDEKDFERHVDYIHYNPVKHGYVKRVRDWPYSTFHRYQSQGILPRGWSENEGEDSGGFGERK